MSKLRSPETPRFIELGAAGDRGDIELQTRIAQGVSKRREQTKVFKLTTTSDKVALKTLIQAAYRQVFERDINPYVVKNEFTALESKLGNNEINLKEFIEGLGCSSLYVKQFYAPYPNTKVIELGTKHFLAALPQSSGDSDLQPNLGK